MALLSSDVVFGTSKLKDFSVGDYVLIRPHHSDDLVDVGIVSKVLSNGVYVNLPLTETEKSNGTKEVRIPVRDLKIVSIEEFKAQGGQLISNIVKETNAPVQVTLEELEETFEECMTPAYQESYFLSYYSVLLNENGDEFNPRFQEYLNDDDIQKYFTESVMNRI